MNIESVKNQEKVKIILCKENIVKTRKHLMK